MDQQERNRRISEGLRLTWKRRKENAMNADTIKLQEICEELDTLADLVADSEDQRVKELPIVQRLNTLIDTYWPGKPKVWVERRRDGKPVGGSALPSGRAAQSGDGLSSTLQDKAQSLRNAVSFGKENGKLNLIVDLDLLDEIFRGNVPVGGNQYPPEVVNEKLYEVKGQRDKLLWKMSSICDLADDELRRFGAVPGSNVSQIEADSRAVLDEIRASILPKPKYDAEPPDCAFASPEDQESLGGNVTKSLTCICPPIPRRWHKDGCPMKATQTADCGPGQPLTCANCGEVSTNPGQFTPDGLWLCTEVCRKELGV
jgi:hypothetical protein